MKGKAGFRLGLKGEICFVKKASTVSLYSNSVTNRKPPDSNGIKPMCAVSAWTIRELPLSIHITEIPL